MGFEQYASNIMLVATTVNLTPTSQPALLGVTSKSPETALVFEGVGLKRLYSYFVYGE